MQPLNYKAGTIWRSNKSGGWLLSVIYFLRIHVVVKESVFSHLFPFRSGLDSGIRETGFTCAEEMLYPANFSYLSDLLGYVAVGARSVDGVKRRTRAGMGRCQGGFCGPRVTQILARELGIPVEKVLKERQGSELFYKKFEE